LFDAFEFDCVEFRLPPMVVLPTALCVDALPDVVAWGTGAGVVWLSGETGAIAEPGEV
jgi:hypothetical protein